MNLASYGLTSREIGAELHLAEETIKSIWKVIYPELQARNRTHAVAIAIRRGLIP